MILTTIKRTIKLNLINRFGYQLKRIPSSPDHIPRVLWDIDANFLSIMDQISKRSLVDKTRCFMLYQYAQQALNIPGDVAEIGVYKGGTAKLLSKVMQTSQKVIHLFDTFSGMPDTDPDRDLHNLGDFSDTSLIEDVQKFLSDCHNLRFYQGYFPNTAGPVANLHFCLVHVDADIYNSVLDCCRFFYPKLEKGGIMIFDDYGFPTCPGAKLAVDEFFLDKIENPCYLLTGQCLVTKL